MEKIKFLLADNGEEVEFFVLEQTRVGGRDYLLVTDSEEDDAEALILKDISEMEELQALYEIVEDDEELESISKIFEEMLDDIEFE